MSAYLDHNEQLAVQAAAAKLGISVIDERGYITPAYSQLSGSAASHKQQHGSLADWSPRIRKGSNLAAEFARIDREADAKRKAATQAAGIQPRYASKAEVQHVMRVAHDACMTDDQPSASAMLREAGVPAEEATRLASKHSIHTEKAWQELENHPARVAMREHEVTSRRKERGALSGSLAGTVAALYSLAEHTKDRQRLSAIEDEVAKLKARVASLETRQTVTEIGEHWHDIARCMRASGATPTEIAKATGQLVNTVKQYLKRNR
ncbi:MULTISPECIES: helix-turn-helix domain-containing protein [unclassified Pseudomonas]|uniref:helix-turn-helix domain-containing protein n=1 Tax=unclassified Pseudomonas TaxID=196821 RepID=UPI00257A565D|nr:MULTISPECIES: helix-turn-helix domain-containing protein [unclassified Pseudomonas]